MRNFFSLVLSFLIIMACVPALSLIFREEILQNKPVSSETKTAAETAAQKEDAQSPAPSSLFFSSKKDKVKVYLHTEKKTVSVNTRFYIISVLAKEIDIDAPKEALKAQAVCIYTFLKHAAEQAENKNYDITDDPAHHQAFLSEKKLKAFWGDRYKENYRKLEKIVDAVHGEYLAYQGKTALAAYHSSNAGKTESAAVCWGEDYPYLTPVTSIGDTLCNTYKTKAVFSPEALRKALETLENKDFSFPKSPSDWVGAVKTTPSATVSTIEIGGVPLTGREVREALKLKSSFFTIRYQNGKFVFKVSGFGHGVGLSQEGAKYMAKLGFNYRAILLHYYNGVAIKAENSI